MRRLGGLPRRLFGTRLYANAFYLWANSAVTSASGLIFWIVVARLYNAEDVGLAAAAVSALMLLGVMSSLGLGLGLIRFLPEAGDRTVSILNGSFTLGALAATAIAIIFLLGLPIWSPSLAFLREQPLQFVLYTLFAIFVTVGSIQMQAFVALRRAEFVLLASAAGIVLKLGLPVALAAFLAPFTIVGAWASGAVLGVVVSSFWLLRRAHGTYWPAINLKRWPALNMLSYSFGNHISVLLLSAPDFLLPLIVVSRLGGETGAYFYVAWAVSMVIVTVPVALSLSLFSEGSHYRQRLHGDLWRALGTALVLSALAAGVLFVAADKLLLVFGGDYAREGKDVLRLLALAALPACVTNLYLGVERVRKALRRLILVSLVVAGMTLGGGYALLPSLGIKGVAIAWLAAQCMAAAIATGQYFFERSRLTRALALQGADR
jgi:O-antigen/teichoic acid export membrane protein